MSPSPAPKANVRADDGPDVNALQTREPWAVRRWIHGERTFVRRVLVRFGAPSHDLDELVQEVVFQALRGLPTFRGDAKVTTWLYSIARNVAYAHQRQRTRARHVAPDVLCDAYVDADATHDTGGGPSSGTWGDPHAETSRREWQRIIDHALQRLPDHYAEVIRLRDLQEHTTAEAADVIGTSEVNTRVRLHRARKKLRTLLEPYVERRE